MIYDMIIIGGGPAGITAGIYALRANKKVLILEKEVVGGKVASSPLIENYPGLKEIKGIELCTKLQEQVSDLGGEIQFKEVIEICEKENKKQIMTKDQQIYESYTVIIATGSQYKMLGLPEEKQWIGKGLSFCATCDGFFYRNKIVAVVGGGNTAIINALELANVCKKVYVLQLLDHLTGEAILTKRLQEKSNIEILYKVYIKKIIGEKKMKQLEIEQDGSKKILEIDGVFLAIGQIPETEMLKNFIQMNKENYITVDQEYQTNRNGIFAAGDCINKKIKQLTTAVNDGTIAALNGIEYLENIENK